MAIEKNLSLTPTHTHTHTHGCSGAESKWAAKRDKVSSYPLGQRDVYESKENMRMAVTW